MSYSHKSTDDFKLEQLFCKKLEGENGRVFSFAQGRAALYAGLRALNLPENSHVMLAGYTSVGVANAIIYAGLKPLYIDIEPIYFNIDITKLPKAPKNVSALIVQHSYGVSADMRQIVNYCNKHNIQLIEDCCHSFASHYHGKKLGRFGVFSFFSGQWQKFFTTGLGGFIYSENQGFQERITEIHQQARTPSSFENMLSIVKLRGYHLCRSNKQRKIFTAFCQKYLTSNRERGSSDPLNLRHITPANFLSKLTTYQTAQAIKALTDIEKNITHRKEIGAIYGKALSEIGFTPIPDKENCETVYLRYPICIQSKHDFLKQAKRYNINIGDWFSAPLHNHKAPLDVYQYQTGSCPTSELICNHMVNLPTDLYTSPKEAKRIVTFLQQYASPMTF